MSSDPSTISLEDLFEKIKRAMSDQTRNVIKRVQKIRDATHHYESSAKQGVTDVVYERNGLRAGNSGARAADAALALLAAVESLPELTTGLDVPEVDEEAPEVSSWPKVKAQRKPLLLFGGMVIPEKLAGWIEETGLDIIWIATQSDGARGMNATDTAAAQLQNGQYFAVLILSGFIDHHQWTPVAQAARAGGAISVAIDKGGVGMFRQALTTLEKRLP